MKFKKRRRRLNQLRSQTKLNFVQFIPDNQIKNNTHETKETETSLFSNELVYSFFHV